jgi:hypothetical protein
MSRKHLSDIKAILDHGIDRLRIRLTSSCIVLLGMLVGEIGPGQMIGISLQFPLTSASVR